MVLLSPSSSFTQEYASMNFILLLSLASTAQAGKLAEGYRSTTWGLNESFPAPEETGCLAKPEEAVAWTCSHKIGEVDVMSSYLYQFSILSGVMVIAKGFVNCDKLINTLETAYGPSKPLSKYRTGRMDQRYWTDGEVWASYQWNQFSSECSLGILHNPSVKKVEALKKEAAGKAASDL